MKVVVDADACPRACLQVLQRHRKTLNYRLLTVASVDHQIDNPDHITVGKGQDAADLAVINNTGRGDIVVTQDWGLAALVLGKGPGRSHLQDGSLQREILTFSWKRGLSKPNTAEQAAARRVLPHALGRMIESSRKLPAAGAACRIGKGQLIDRIMRIFMAEHHFAVLVDGENISPRF